MEKCGRDRQATDDSIMRRMHIACWRNKTADTLRICNVCCFSTATMVARMGLSVTFCLHCPSCLLTSSSTKQVPASYPTPSFRWFLSPLPYPTSFSLPELENGVVLYSCILGSMMWWGGLVFFVVEEFSPNTQFFSTSNCSVLLVSCVEAHP